MRQHLPFRRFLAWRRTLGAIGMLAMLPAFNLPQASRANVPAAAGRDAIAYFVAQDARIAAIAFRLKTANLSLCARHGFEVGLVVHALDAYARPLRAAAAEAFGLGVQPNISAVVPGGPAAKAGLQPGDRLLSVDGMAFPTALARPPAGGTYDTTQRALDLIDGAAADGRVHLVLMRGDMRREMAIEATPACVGRVQLVPSREMNAWSDDRYATITTAIARYAEDDDDLALILGHELAHLFLGHEALLKRRGRSARLVLKTERDADYLGLYLMARAGFDISDTAGFWRRFAANRGSANFLWHTHPGGKERVRDTEATVAEIEQQEEAGRIPLPQRIPLGVGDEGSVDRPLPSSISARWIGSILSFG